jgi:N-acetylmuramoyl-L-alanine amidase
MTIILDPGHGMSNRRSGVYDPGAVSNGVTEAEIAMVWANELRRILVARKHRVIRTRVDDQDPAPVSRRDDIARSYKGDLMVSLHCNAHNGKATGTEVFYRGPDDKAMAVKLSAAVSRALGLKDRGAKTEAQSQHSSLAVLDFDKCWLIELGFIDNPIDRAKLLNADLRSVACHAIAAVLLEHPLA